MKTSNGEVGREGSAPGICANEGCERPARGRFCDTCALEWSLFHREQRSDGRQALARALPPRADRSGSGGSG